MRLLTAMAALAALAACTILPEPERYVTYRLPAPTPETAGQAQEALPATLRLTPPRASDRLASSRILVALEGERLSAYSGARWVSPAPKLWQDAMATAFRADGRLPKVIAGGERLPADLELRSTLRAFEIDRSTEDEAQARAVLHARLIALHERDIVATRRFTASAPLAKAETEGAVAALGDASRELTEDLIEWTITQAAEHSESPRY